jgi:hypothetical protein
MKQKQNFQIGDLFIARPIKHEMATNKPLFKQGYIYNIEKVKTKTKYFIRWEKDYDTPHYMLNEGMYTKEDIQSFINDMYIYFPVKK